MNERSLSFGRSLEALLQSRIFLFSFSLCIHGYHA